MMRNVVCWLLILGGFAYLLVGCADVYRSLGMTDEEAVEQQGKDTVEIIKAIESGREVFWQAATAIVTGLGAVISAVLAKWLGTEKKVSGAAISAVVRDGNGDVLKLLRAEAAAQGVGKTMANRIDAATV